jgi:PAS domain S-box-containing protein
MKSFLRALQSLDVALTRRHATLLIGAAALLVTTSIVATALSLNWMHEREVEDRLDGARRTLEAVSRHIADRYDMLDVATQTIVELIDGRDLTTVDVAELLQMRQRVDATHIGIELRTNIWLPDGRSPFPEAGEVSIGDRDFFQAHTDPRISKETHPHLFHGATGLVIGAPVQARLIGRPILPVSRAVRDQSGKLLGVVVASVPVQRMLETFEFMRRNPNDTIFFLRNDRTGMVRLPFDSRFSGQVLANPIAFQNYPEVPSGRFEGAAQTDGIRRVGVRQALTPLPLVAAISLETRSLGFESLRRFLPIIAISAFQLVAVCMFAAIALFTLLRALRERDRSEASGARLRGVLETASDGIVILDGDMRVRGFNAAAERMFGREAAEVVGGPLDPLIPVGLRSRHTKHIAEFAAGNVRARQMRDWRVVSGLHCDGTTFPIMASISKADAGGEPIYLAVVRDMSEAAATEARLVEAAREAQRLRHIAEEASQAKSLFLATMSHELRTPLNAIIGFSEALSDGIAGPVVSEKQREYLGYVVTSGRHLLDIINDIIDISRLQSGTHTLHIESVDIQNAVDLAETVLRHRLDAKQISLVRTSVSDGLQVTADLRALRQILINIIGNAIKFSPAGAKITCSWGTKNGQVTIRICDEGPGMSPAVMSNIGNPFNQDRDLLRADNEGVGLGLAISTELAQSMGGSLTFENLPQAGLEVTITLPGAS